jgi:hypothetical protein
MQMWTQLNLFDEQTDIDFAMSLTTAQFIDLKYREEYSYNWVKQIREVVQRYRSMKKVLDGNFERDLEIARAGPHKRYGY